MSDRVLRHSIILMVTRAVYSLGSICMPKIDACPQSQTADSQIDGALYENSPDCIKVLTFDGTIKRLSPGGQVALELDRPDQLNGSHWPSLWPGSEQPRVQQAMEEAREGRRTQFLAFCPTMKNTPRWWDVVVSPISGPEGGVLAVSRDVTELVAAREALLLADERKNQFITALSHELRNPLSTLSMALKIVETSKNDCNQLDRLVETMKRQVGHMSRLAEDLLDISRITRGQVKLLMADFDVREAVQEASEQLMALTSAKGQKIRTTMRNEAALVRGDRMRLVQVLGNLIANASRYSPANSLIEIVLSAQNGAVDIAVVDQGIGISDELLPKLFDTYSRGQGSADTRTSGVGLGLAIVKGLIDLHYGTIKVDSAGPGMGSTFTISLPSSTSALASSEARS